MNASEFAYLLNKPAAVRERQLESLDHILERFPYFQSARALLLKALYSQDSFRYNDTLKTTAAYTCDRSILFDFITSGQFTGLQHAFLLEQQARINEIEVHGSQWVQPPQTEETTSPLQKSILSLIRESAPAEEPRKSEIEEKLEIGKPLSFSREETHSFQEWLQLASFKPIVREEPEQTAQDNKRNKKFDLIDRFIENNPRIVPSKATTPAPPPPIQEAQDNSYLMTETLAKVYLEQKKYQKAIQAYEILILKYPEKSSLFADRISDIKELQQNNN